MDTLNIPAGYRIERGLLWPADDSACAAVVFDTTGDADQAINLCKNKGLAIQAGGNCGVWALHFASKFDRVVTFEPDPVNFRALVWNTSSAENILSLPCALGKHGGEWCDMDREPGNAGAHQVRAGNVAPVVSIDGLALTECDLIYLDIEGSEMDAIFGAAKTIDQFRPIIAVEDKGLSRRYGFQKEEIVKHLALAHGYRVSARPNRDVIMVPND